MRDWKFEHGDRVELVDDILDREYTVRCRLVSPGGKGKYYYVSDGDRGQLFIADHFERRFQRK